MKGSCTKGRGKGKIVLREGKNIFKRKGREKKLDCMN